MNFHDIYRSIRLSQINTSILSRSLRRTSLLGVLLACLTMALSDPIKLQRTMSMTRRLTVTELLHTLSTLESTLTTRYSNGSLILAHTNLLIRILKDVLAGVPSFLGVPPREISMVMELMLLELLEEKRLVLQRRPSSLPSRSSLMALTKAVPCPISSEVWNGLSRMQ